MAFQGKVWEIIVRLLDEDTLEPMIAVPYSDAIVKLRKPYTTSFATKTLTPSNWTNLGSGFYAILLSLTDTSTVGVLTFTVNASGAKPEGGIINVVPEPFYIKPSPPKCILFGSIANIAGEPTKPLQISFRPLSVPKLQASTLLSAETIYTYTDAAGNFSVSLIRDMLVMVECEPIGLKVQVRLPASETVDLASILPPIPPELI